VSHLTGILKEFLFQLKEYIMAHLLVIDDEGDIRHLYAAELEDEGHSVVTCGNRNDAMEQIRHQVFDLVILDIQLDQESGLELLQQIAHEQEKIPVILCTAYSCYKDDFSSWLADAYVVKSSNLDELKNEVRRILAQP
jgi:DNA-binding NtrC family response regulator